MKKNLKNTESNSSNLTFKCSMAVVDTIRNEWSYEDLDGPAWLGEIDDKHYRDIVLAIRRDRTIDIYSIRKRPLSMRRGKKIIEKLLQDGFAVIEPESPFAGTEYEIPAPDKN